MPASRIAKGEERRRRIVRAAVTVLREQGPGGLTHRTVAARAGVPLASTTYYFTGRSELLREAGEAVIATWATYVERVVERAAPRVGDDRGALLTALLDAVLPRRTSETAPHYQHLLATADVPELVAAHAAGRARIDAALAALLRSGGSRCSAQLAVAVIDGATVSALSEGRPVRSLARELLAEVV